MTNAQTMTSGELAALLYFHAEAGVEWLLEDEPVDRFQAFEAMQKSNALAKTNGGQLKKDANSSRAAARSDAPPPPRPMANVAMPDEQAVAEAVKTAKAANNLEDLRLAMQAFGGCNLKNSARNTLFASGNPNPQVMIIGSAPNADDDREGLPFSGKAGNMLDLMLQAIRLKREDVLLSQTIAWRPPGNRMPTAAESDICRPFIERQIELAKPQFLLLLGNFPARFFLRNTETIQTLRGTWHDVSIGEHSMRAMATYHPQDLITAPISKRLAWADLLEFSSALPR